MAVPDTPHRPPEPAQRAIEFPDESPPAADEAAYSAAVTIDRIRPPVKAHGGKFYLARRIVPILLGVRARVTEYLEPCAFGASVFLAMPRFEGEMLGDINPDVVALWTVLARSALAEALVERLA